MFDKIGNLLLSIQSELPIADVPKIDESNFVSNFKGLSFEDTLTKLVDGLVNFSFKLAIAVLVFYVGKLIIKKLYTATRNILHRKKVDASLTTFVLSLIRIVLYFILIVTIIGILGIETSSFLALFASAGVAIGMALSGTLQNFAGGVLILLLKPYKVGDYIEAQGYSGTVKEIQIFHTIINTIDNKAIIIPNGGLSTGSINNFSLEDYRRVDWTVCLAYGTDFDSAKKVILSMLNSDSRVVKQYIEDDRINRAVPDAEAESVDDEDSSPVVEPKKNFWQRWRIRRKERREHIEESIREREKRNAPVPQKILREPFVALGELADSSINITVRAWTHSSNYWELFYDMNQRFYTELPKQGFEFPFPQLDVHLNKIL